MAADILTKSALPRVTMGTSGDVSELGYLARTWTQGVAGLVELQSGTPAEERYVMCVVRRRHGADTTESAPTNSGPHEVASGQPLMGPASLMRPLGGYNVTHDGPQPEACLSRVFGLVQRPGSLANNC